MYLKAIAVGLLLGGPVFAQDNPAAFAEAWVTAFELRDTGRFSELLSDQYQHTSACAVLGRDQEVATMETVFGNPGRFEILSVGATIVGEGPTDGKPGASLLFEYGFRNLSHPETPEIQGSDIIIAFDDGSGRWTAKNWLEVYRGDFACEEHLMGVMESWLGSTPTVVGSMSFAGLKIRQRD